MKTLPIVDPVSTAACGTGPAALPTIAPGDPATRRGTFLATLPSSYCRSYVANFFRLLFPSLLLLLLQPAHPPAAVPGQVDAAADAALYRDMREALAHFEAQARQHAAAAAAGKRCSS